jgi:hypothetical protein
MNNSIENLKTLAEYIQTARINKEVERNPRSVSDKYHEWRTLSEDLFEKYFDRSNSHYEIFISLPRDGNAYTVLGYFTQQYPIFKVLIDKIEAGETMRTIVKSKEPEIENKKEGKTIFVSHSKKDEVIATAFVDIILQGGLSVHINEIFCTSTDGTKIQSGTDWRDSIKQNLLSAKLNFLIITPNYKESEVCLNEMGAAWVTSAIVLPLIVDPINYKTVGIIQEPNQIEKLLDEKSLDKIKDIIQEELKIHSSSIKSDRWTVKKKEFLSIVKRHLASNPFQVPMDRNAFYKLQNENVDLNKTVDNLIEEKVGLEDLIKVLEQAKDKEAVEKIKKRYNPNTDYEEFVRVSKEIHLQLIIFSSIIRGIIFKEYTGKNVNINWEQNWVYIDEAIAQDFITEDFKADWDTTSEMQDVYESLNHLSEILDKDYSESFKESFLKDYQAPMKLDNKKFWENVFDVIIEF